jgi:hypothetical protein
MRRLIIILLVLVGLAVAADFGSAALAESAVSRQMRGQLGLVDDPSVRINGSPSSPRPSPARTPTSTSTPPASPTAPSRSWRSTRGCTT